MRLSQTPIEYPPQCSRSASAKLLTLSGSMYDLTAEQEQEAARLHEAERLREMGVPLAQERLWTTQLQLPPTVVHGKQLVGALAFNQSDRSPEAVEWRQSSAVKLAWDTGLANGAFFGAFDIFNAVATLYGVYVLRSLLLNRLLTTLGCSILDLARLV